MADTLTTQSATLSTIPASSIIATDDAGAAGHVQIIKLAISTDGSATAIPADAANGLDVDVSRVQGNVTVIQGTAASLNMTEANSGSIKTAVELIDNAISGTEMQVDVVAALPAGTNNIGDVDILSIAAGDNNIGNVDIVTMPGLVGTVADDATTPGNPLMIGGKAVETDGTDPTSVSAEDDVAIVRTDRNRRLLVNTAHPNLWRVNENHSSAQTNNQLKAAPGSNLSLYVQTLIISNGATAGTVKIVEDEGGTPADLLGPYYFAINGGIAITFEPPVRLATNKSLGFTSATVTTHTVTITGYTAP